MTARRLGAEFAGTALLLLAIVGSGITAAGGGSGPVRLFEHAVVVGVALATLIVVFGSVSGAHFNPVVTLADALLGGIGWRMAGAYAAVQVTGALAGTVLASVLFGLPPVALATTDRTGAALAASEAVATFGLVVVIFGALRTRRGGVVAAAVGGWIGGAVYFTSSAAFANPAVTLARVLTDSFTGIAPAAVPGFLLAQVAGALAAAAFAAWLFRPDASQAADVVVPHGGARTRGERP